MGHSEFHEILSFDNFGSFLDKPQDNDHFNFLFIKIATSPSMASVLV